MIVPVPANVVTKAKKIQEPCCIATSLARRTATDVEALYVRRFTIEEAFCDTKDVHFGMGSGILVTRFPQRPRVWH
jgi:hypothetical protein